ncbi:MAG: hypothetical protein ACE5G6_01125 [Terriglobia bacterium]
MGQRTSTFSNNNADALRALAGAVRHLENLRQERPAGRNLVQPEQDWGITPALEILYERIHQLQGEQPSRLRELAAKFSQGLAAWARRLGLSARPPGPTRWVICPERGLRAAVGVVTALDISGTLRVVDVTRCSLFPKAPLLCHKQCLQQL